MASRLPLHMMAKWDVRFLEMAQHVSQWSRDPSTQVGAVIVSADRTQIHVGYNGFPRGIEDSDERYNDRDLKYKFVVHAEVNAILNARQSVAGMTMYCSLHPCGDCAKAIIQAGIKRVICPVPTEEQMQRWGDSLLFAKDMLQEAYVDLTMVTYE